MRFARALLSFAVLSLAACGTPGTCKCATGQRCVFRAGSAEPTCEWSCTPTDAGALCPSGLSCGCASSCAGCKDCAPVCL
jgi:hypothetical protein